MFARDETGRLSSPHPDLGRTVCGSCAVCNIHLKSSTEPKLLPCLHTACQVCLKKICRDRSTYECPLCMQSFSLFEITDCLIFEDSSDINEDPKCAACEETEVSGWCVQCEEALCLDCVSAHRRVKVTRDHEVISKKPPAGWMPRRSCPSHRQESLRFFCLFCEELTCKDCQLITHRGHSFVQQEEAVGLQRHQLQNLLESIRKQKEMVSTSLLLLEARLKHIEKVKLQTSKTLTQLVRSFYHSLLLRARQTLKEVETLYAEEVKSLLDRKTSLNRMEGLQDYLVMFIDKILSTEGHCVLVHKKRIDTQVKKLLSQNSCPPELMFELQLKIQKDLYQNIMTHEIIKVEKVAVPFAAKNECIWTKTGERPNPPTDRSNVDIHPALPASSSDQSTAAICSQFQQPQANRGSSNCVPNVRCPTTPLNLPPVYSQPCPSDWNPTTSRNNNISQLGKHQKNWTFHYYPTLQTTLVPSSTQTTRHKKPIATYNQTPRITYPMPANNHTSVHQHPLPLSPTDIRTPVLTQVILANSQTPVLAVPVPTNIQTPEPTNPVSGIPTDTQTLILAQPIQANVLEVMHTFAAQPNMSQTVPSTINTFSANEVPAVYTDQPHDSSTLNATIPIFSTTTTTANGSSLPENPKDLSHCSTNLPVKALADSACDQEANVSSTDFTDIDNPENNLPTSTVSETDPKELLPATRQDPACSAVLSTNLPTTTTTENCSPIQSSDCLLKTPTNQDQADHSDSHSKPGHWSVGMPVSFYQLVVGTPAASVPCSVSEGKTLITSEKATTTRDETVQRNLAKNAKEEAEESAVTLEHTQQLKSDKVLQVSLVRLPVSLPACGQPLPNFYLSKDASTDHILVQETHGGQIKQVWRLNEDPSSSSSFLSVAQDSNSPMSCDGQICIVCQMTGATLLCSKCGRGYHSDCHIPPIFVKLCDKWVCLLCLNVNDEIISYGSERTRGLSTQDQRKCEKILLSLLCAENKNLLYSVQLHSKVTEFEIILGRLLGKQKPPYRTPGELVSDVWTLFDFLSKNSEKREVVAKLQNIFQKQLNESFGESLHPSLLRHTSNEASKNSPDNEREKHKKTLKRMREFFTANCSILAKKPCTDLGNDREDYGNSGDNEH